MNAWLEQNLVELLGWTLVHFVWQGLVIAALLAVCLRLLRNAAPNHRYLAGCAAMLLLVVAPIITFQCLQAQQTPLFSTPAATPAFDLNKLVSDPNVTVDQFYAAFKHQKPSFSQRLEMSLPWLVFGWCIGVLALSCRLFAGWLQIKRIKSRATAALDEFWHRRLAELSKRLGMDRPVMLLQSAFVEVPTVIGWLRPVILLPVGCLVGLSTAQLEAILAHELAHIRRHDYLINLFQNVVEILLFYHPAVWWVSRRIREERENCCDDLAVEICGDRLTYARALATLEELRHAPGQLALAAAGAPLLLRIRRLLGKSGANASRPGWPLAGIVALLIIIALAVGLRGNRLQAAGENNSPTKTAPNESLTNQAASTSSPDTNFLKPRIITDPQVENLLTHGTLVNVPAHTNLVHAGLGIAAIRAKLNQIHIDSVKYDNLPLGEVIMNVAELSKARDPDQVGINYFVNRGNSIAATGTSVSTEDATTVKIVVPTLNNIRLVDLLDAIVRGADRPIKYSVLDYAVVFSLRDANAGPLEYRVFHVDPNTFRQGLESVVGVPFGNTSGYGNSGSNSGGNSASSQPGVILPHVNVSSGVTSGSVPDKMVSTPDVVRKFFAAIGVDFDTNNPANAGKAFAFNDRKGILQVRATTNEVAKIEAALFALQPAAPQVDIKVKIVQLQKPPAFPGGVYSGGLTNAASINGVLTEAQYKTTLEALSRRDDATILTGPEVTTFNSRQVQVQTTAGTYDFIKTMKTSTIPAIGSNGARWNPVLDVTSRVSEDKTHIDLTAIPTLAEYVNSEPAKPAVGDFPDYDPKKFSPSGSSSLFASSLSLPPHFRLRSTTNNFTVLNGQTIVMGAPGTTSATNTNGYTMIFVTSTLVSPDGSALTNTPVKDLAKVDAGDQKPNRPNEINLKVRFVEIDEAQSHKTGLDWFFNHGVADVATVELPQATPLVFHGFSNTFPAVTNSITLQISGTLTPALFKQRIGELEKLNGVDELHAPEVTTESGRQAQVQTVDVTTVVMGRETSLDTNGQAKYEYQTAKIPCGPIVDLTGYISDDDSHVRVMAIPSITEFLGYEDPRVAGKLYSDPPPSVKAMEPLPRFRLSQMVADVSVSDGNTIVLGGVGWETVNVVKDKTPLLGDLPLLGKYFRRTTTSKSKKNLLVFVTPTIINPDGTRYHTDEKK